MSNAALARVTDMVIRLLTIDLHFPGRSSLKEKRFVLSSLKAKLSQRYNVAVAEVGYQEKWQRSLLAVVTVGVDGRAGFTRRGEDTALLHQPFAGSDQDDGQGSRLLRRLVVGNISELAGGG